MEKQKAKSGFSIEKTIIGNVPAFFCTVSMESGDLNVIMIFFWGPKQPARSWPSGTRNDNPNHGQDSD
jgi:hypothetical protein